MFKLLVCVVFVACKELTLPIGRNDLFYIVDLIKYLTYLIQLNW